MNCPICRKEVNLGDPDFPFCTPRCRLIDLANLATGKYAIPAEPLEPEPPEPEDD